MKSSIRIVPEDQLKKSVFESIDPLLFNDLGGIYDKRIKRLSHLANAMGPMTEYLQFTQRVVNAQAHVLAIHPLKQESMPASLEGIPLDGHELAAPNYWQDALNLILKELNSSEQSIVQHTVTQLACRDSAYLEAAAGHLLKTQFDQVDSAEAVFIWAALSLTWAQMARHLKVKGFAQEGESRQYCPVCGSAPIASEVLIGSKQGLRYLHCSLCEAQWHMVRSKCTNCENTGKLSYWILEPDNDDDFKAEEVSVKAESCDDCESYLKVFYPEKDRHVDVIADDLVSIALDAEVEQEGYAKSGINPFLLPTGST